MTRPWLGVTQQCRRETTEREAPYILKTARLINVEVHSSGQGTIYPLNGYLKHWVVRREITARSRIASSSRNAWEEQFAET